MRPLRSIAVPAAVFVIGLLGATNKAGAVDFIIVGNSQTDTVRFESTARLEFIEGSNHDISGRLGFDPKNLSAVNGILQVDLRTLKTGIDLRDEHMREKHLETDEFPFAYFEIDSVSGFPRALENHVLYSGKVAGYFYLHGVKKRIEAQSSVEWDEEARAISVLSQFQIDLDDFDIERPKALFLKLAETIKVRIVFKATSSGKPTEIELPGW